MVLVETIKYLPRCRIPPPSRPALFRLTVLWSIKNQALPLVEMPPPSRDAQLLSIVEPLRIATPSNGSIPLRNRRRHG